MEVEQMRRRLASALRELDLADLRVRNAAADGEWSRAVWEARDVFNAAARVLSACERAYADDLGGVKL